MSGWQYTKGLFWFIGLPAIIWLFILWDPIIGKDENGDLNRIGFWLILVPYWVVLYIIYKYKTKSKELEWYLKKIIDKETGEKEKEALIEECRHKEYFGDLR